MAGMASKMDYKLTDNQNVLKCKNLIYIEREGERELFSFCVLLMTKACSKWLRYRTFIKMNLMLAFYINFISKNYTVSNIVMNEF